MSKLLDKYLNGNALEVKKEVANTPGLLSELFNEYVEEYNPSIYNLTLFVRRLAY